MMPPTTLGRERHGFLTGVIVTTLTDIFGFVAFLGAGTLLLDRLV